MADIPGDTSTTATITVGGSTNNSLEALGDHDWFKISLDAGQSIVVTVTAAAGGDLDTTLNLYDPSGTNVLAYNDDINLGIDTNSRIGFTATTSGTYYIDVGAFQDGTEGQYTLSVQAYVPPPVYTYDQIANQLTDGYWDWDGQERHRFNVSQGGTITVNISALTTDEQTLARAALATWKDIIGINFQEVTGTTNGLPNGQIVFSNAEDPDNPGPTAYTTSTSDPVTGITEEANVNISTSWLDGTGLDSYGFQTYLHEIGHALGLGHSGNYNGSANYIADALYANDSWATSIMSYFAQDESFYFQNQGFTYAPLVTPMEADIVAMQQLYGLSTTTRTGNTTYGFNSNAGDAFNAVLYPNVAYTIFDNGGVDTLDYSAFAADQSINLTPETFMNIGDGVGNVMIARGVTIEKAIGGSGNDAITGNGVANTLTGNAGNDTLSGGAGADTMTGGIGNDTYVVDSAADVVTENAGQGTDLVQSSISYTLGANVERLTLTGSAAISGTGNSVANVITGNSGANTLYGGAGADTMNGGAGNDTYFVDSAGDAVTESSGAGTDLVKASVSYTLGANLENLILTGTAAINGTGNTLANVIAGNDSANTLSGGAGNDSLTGRGGNDSLIGGIGNDVLNGGAGADGMAGNTGDDRYYVDSTLDSVTEQAGEGTDLVVSSVDFTLGADVERLRLSGSAALDGTGNTLANVIQGNVGANLIDGAAGDDSLWGYGGNDTLVGGAGRDSVVGGTGSDTFLFDDAHFGGATRWTADRIIDFTQGQDKIDLSAVDANSLVGGDQAFSFVGTAAFSGTAGELHYEQVSGNTYVSGDTNGDGTADFMIRLDGLHTLASSDFGF